jgi:S-(hydroxymethyl)glutathione dehydrogenase/alcohol dehydrogenase
VPAKLEMAKRFGATHAVSPDELQGAKQDITRGEGFDYALECVGNPTTIRATYDAVRRGGTAVVVGVGRMDQKIEFSAFELFYAEKNLKGSMYGSANVRVDFDRLLRLWKAGKLDLEGMISRRIKLEQVNEAFRAMQAGEVIRSVIDYQ